MRRRISKVFIFIAMLGAVSLVIACGKMTSPTENESLSISTSNLSEIYYSKSGAGYPINIKYLDNGFKIEESILSEIEQAWSDSLTLMKTKFREFDKADSIDLHLENITLNEKQRFEILSNGNLKIVEGTGSGETVTTEKASSSAASLEGTLEGHGSEFTMTALFSFKRSDFNGAREFLTFTLSENVNYWKMRFGAKVNISIDAAAIVAMVAKVPPKLANGIGSILKGIGSFNLSLELKNYKAWFAQAQHTQNVLDTQRKTSVLAIKIANEILSPVCKQFLEAQNNQDEAQSGACLAKVYEISPLNMDKEVEKYKLLKAANCKPRHFSKNNVPIYDLFLIAPKPSSDEIDFLIKGSKLQLYQPVSLANLTWERISSPFGVGDYAVYKETVSNDMCSSSSLDKSERCVRAEYGNHYYDFKCTQLNHPNSTLRRAFSALEDQYLEE